MGPEISECPGIARPRRAADAGGNVVYEVRKRRLHFFRLFVVSRIARGRSRRISGLREHAERVQSSMKPEEIKDEPPPVLGRWSRVYALVLCELALVIAAFYWFTVHFAP